MFVSPRIRTLEKMSGEPVLNPSSAVSIDQDSLEVILDLTIAERIASEKAAAAAIEHRRSLRRGYVVVSALYLVAIAAAVATVWIMHSPLWLEVLVADVVATVVTFVGSVVTRNSSMYDPYWSVAPAVVVVGLAATAQSPVNPARIAMITVVTLVWAFRLTANWAYGWDGIKQQDWRYDKLADDTGKAYWLVSFLGIHLFPTLMVFAGMLPFFAAFRSDRSLHVLDFVGVLIALVATAVEGIADGQMHRFRRDHPEGNAVADTGLWSISRHPNYLGEIFFWVGIACIGIAAAPNQLWRAVGVLVMFGLFLGISIPMIEKRHLARKGEKYVSYQRRVPMLIPGLKSKRS